MKNQHAGPCVFKNNETSLFMCQDIRYVCKISEQLIFWNAKRVSSKWVALVTRRSIAAALRKPRGVNLLSNVCKIHQTTTCSWRSF